MESRIADQYLIGTELWYSEKTWKLSKIGNSSEREQKCNCYNIGHDAIKPCEQEYSRNIAPQHSRRYFKVLTDESIVQIPNRLLVLSQQYRRNSTFAEVALVQMSHSIFSILLCQNENKIEPNKLLKSSGAVVAFQRSNLEVVGSSPTRVIFILTNYLD